MPSNITNSFSEYFAVNNLLTVVLTHQGLRVSVTFLSKILQ